LTLVCDGAWKARFFGGISVAYQTSMLLAVIMLMAGGLLLRVVLAQEISR
jgi:hypothetical protein